MNYRITGDFRAPFRVFPVIEETSPHKVELLLKVRADIPENNYGANVTIRFPVPRNAATVHPELSAASAVTSGPRAGASSGAGGAGAGGTAGQAAEYRAKDGQVVWQIKKFVGGTEHTLRTRITLSSPSNSSVRKEMGPIAYVVCGCWLAAAGIAVWCVVCALRVCMRCVCGGVCGVWAFSPPLHACTAGGVLAASSVLWVRCVRSESTHTSAVVGVVILRWVFIQHDLRDPDVQCVPRSSPLPAHRRSAQVVQTLPLGAVCHTVQLVHVPAVVCSIGACPAAVCLRVLVGFGFPCTRASVWVKNTRSVPRASCLLTLAEVSCCYCRSQQCLAHHAACSSLFVFCIAEGEGGPSV